jgi:hypothetical protein
MSDTQELERHILVLESQLGWEGEVGEEIADLREEINVLNRAFGVMCEALDRNTAKLSELINAMRQSKRPPLR